MISEGPALIEALPGQLQNALNGALQPGEELLIAVRGNVREAFAATGERLLVLKEPIIGGVGSVEVRDAALSTVSEVRSEPRPVGGRLLWESSEPGAPTSIEYPTYDASKYQLVAQRLQQMIGQPRNPTTPGTAPPAPPVTTAGRACPKCGVAVPDEGSWCSRCGLQVSDPCWECGRPLAEGANFCAFCGTPNTEPAVVQCPECQAVVGRQHGYCSACGAQARMVCADCDRPLRKEWAHCPSCGGEAAWEAEGVRPQIAYLRGDEPEDPSAWLPSAPGTDEVEDDDATGPGEAEELNAAGIRAYEAEDFHEAARLFRKAIEADGTQASFYTNLGVAYGELDQDAQALEAYQQAIRVNPMELAAYLNMGYLYNHRERQTEAREMWEKVIQLAPDSEEAGEARRNLNNLEEV